MTDVKEVKLTKAQREFFGDFAKQSVKQVLAPILDFRGLEVNDEVLDRIVNEVDLTELTKAIGIGFLDRVEFKTLTKIDKILKSEEFIAVATASGEVNALVQATLVEVIAPLIPLTEEEKAAKAEKEAQLELDV